MNGSCPAARAHYFFWMDESGLAMMVIISVLPETIIE